MLNFSPKFRLLRVLPTLAIVLLIHVVILAKVSVALVPQFILATCTHMSYGTASDLCPSSAGLRMPVPKTSAQQNNSLAVYTAQCLPVDNTGPSSITPSSAYFFWVSATCITTTTAAWID
eukprot:PhF_6_TR43301/c0_g1_i1/m.66203